MNEAVSSLKPEEREAWEAFEVGAFEDVESIARKHTGNAFLRDLLFLSKWQEGNLDKKELQNYEKGTEIVSVFSSLIQSLALSLVYQVGPAWENYQRYLKQKNPLFCVSFIKLGVQLSLDNFAYDACLQLIHLDPNEARDSFYAEEKLICYYNLKKFTEAINHFKRNFKFIPESQHVYFMVGMSLLSKGMYKEAEMILSKQKKMLSLPTYEDKKKEFQDKIEKIPVLEKKPNLSVEELQDLGFAYLFTAQYRKAEEVFNRELNILTTA